MRAHEEFWTRRPADRIGKQTALPTDLRSRREPQRQTPRAPIAGALLESPGDFVTARSTTTVSKIPFTEFVPIALDEQIAATRTPRAAAFAIMNVSGINI